MTLDYVEKNLKELKTNKAIGLDNISARLIDLNFHFAYTKDIHSYDTRNKNNICKPLSRRSWGHQRRYHHGINDWNDSPEDIRKIHNIFKFKCAIFNILS